MGTKEEYLPYGKEKIGRAIWECLKRMYKKATPSADIEKIAKSGEGKMRDFFCGYYLSSEDCQKVVEEIKKEFKLGKIEKQQLDYSVLLGCAPTNSKERWEKDRKDYNKRLRAHMKKSSAFTVKEKLK